MTAPAAINPTPQGVLTLVQKLGDADPDFRFMSLNDLLQLLTNSKPEFLHHDYNIAARTVDSIIKTLDDQNGEVQNLAIKCLGPLVGRVPTPVIAPMIEKISSLKLQNSVDNAVPSLAMRSVITALPRPVPGIPTTPEVQEAYKAVSRVLIPRLIGPGPNTRVPETTTIKLPEVPTGLLQNESDLNAEAIDVLIEVVRCFGSLLQDFEVEAMQEIILHLLESDKGSSVVKKRAVVAMAMLAVYLTEVHLDNVVTRLTSSLSQSSINQVTRRLYISIMGSMARSIPTRFGPHLPKAVPYVLQALSEEELQQHMEQISDGDDLGQEFNEVREAALVALEAFLASCPQEMRNFTKETITSCLRYLKFDPNYAVDEDDEDMDVDEDDEEADDDDEFDADDGFEDDDEDASWKVRRCAAKTIYTLISTRGSGDLLDNGVLYGQAAPSLVKRIDEREENVRLEVISALSLLVRKTGEGLQLNDRALEELEQDTLGQMPLSRKRRRQSSGGSGSVAQFMSGPGVTSPVLEKVPPTGPRADLASLAPSIVKAATKQLKGKTIPTKQAIVKLLDDMVSVQRGGLSEFFPEVIGPIIDAIKPTGSGVSSSLNAAGGSASATPSTLRVAALGLVGDLAKTHSSSVLHPYLTKIVAGVTAAVHDRFYKISSEAIRTVEELVKAITPPRSRNDGAKYKGELQKLFDVIIDRGSANDADAEVRQRAIHALGILIARTMSGDEALLPADKRKNALEILQERLKNETTRLAAVRAVDNVAALATSPGQLEKGWIQDVALELSGQLRKANRSLRGSSIVALKHLTLSPAAKDQLEPATIEGIVSSLMPAINTSDTHLLGPALVILANIVPGNAQLVVTDELIKALCQLLKSHLASIVLEPLLSLVSNIGQSGAGEPLMRGLLKDVSVAGDASVVGKVIGTLLVTGGQSAGVSLDSFVSELKTSAQSGDEARVSLALAVIGEAGMRLGTSSPLKPSLFLEQFHAEPDKVSLSAAIALGRAGSGNVPEFLPIILETMQQGGNTQYLLIQSIKEILQSISVKSPDLREYARAIWDQLLKASDTPDNKVICAECVGRLVTLDPKGFLPQLQTLLKDGSAGVRGMAVQAVRYTLPESDEAFDAMLKTVLIDMLLVMLQDDDMEIRRLAMTTLNSAARMKPDLILPHLGELMPFVLGESVVKKELVREVMLGPFKHTVDDGLEVRKSAYETLYALMETAFTRINNIDLFDRVVAGLKDDNDIRQLCNLMVTKLIVIDPDETARRLDAIADAYRGVLSIKLKDNAVKQDLEKQQEANKSILRVTLLLGEKMKALTGSAGAATGGGPVGVWTGYWEWVNKEYEKELRGLREESKELQTRITNTAVPVERGRQTGGGVSNGGATSSGPRAAPYPRGANRPRGSRAGGRGQHGAVRGRHGRGLYMGQTDRRGRGGALGPRSLSTRQRDRLVAGVMDVSDINMEALVSNDQLLGSRFYVPNGGQQNDVVTRSNLAGVDGYKFCAGPIGIEMVIARARASSSSQILQGWIGSFEPDRYRALREREDVTTLRNITDIALQSFVGNRGLPNTNLLSRNVVEQTIAEYPRTAEQRREENAAHLEGIRRRRDARQWSSRSDASVASNTTPGFNFSDFPESHRLASASQRNGDLLGDRLRAQSAPAEALPELVSRTSVQRVQEPTLGEDDHRFVKDEEMEASGFAAAGREVPGLGRN
ncbi:Cullin-associated NEDD8-dissociated protein 1, C-terminal part [Paramyrothecium foliicola]|nr:Cullin-associated NEDD8-dissociated protein 1, C-terminal part [Paramyrothecium foliicola]